MFQRVLIAAVVGSLAGPLCAQTRPEISQTTQDALLHVVAHEIGHAFLREFDVPVLGPEEAIADDFATVYVYFVFPDRAADIVTARAAQNLADGERSGPFSEYLDDDKRAGRSVCLLYGLDPERYAAFPARFNIPDDDAAACRDFAPEVARGWRRQLATRTMPDDARVTEVQLRADDLPLTEFLSESAFRDDLYTLLARIDWHSTITLSFEDCDGSAAWSRNDRTIRVCDAYVTRFEAQLNP
ncbi:MAG: DUF4344 domain-containing metallopeptidase [Paracoccaceae bacterium]